MIFFLTEWQANVKNIERTAMFNIIRLFDEKNIDYKIIGSTLFPFLRYFQNELGLCDRNKVINLLDQKQILHEGTPFGMNDLLMPTNVEKIYTKDNVRLVRDGKSWGAVYFNDYGYVSECHVQLKGIKRIDVYSDQGFILYSRYINRNSICEKTEIYDSKGSLLLTETSRGVEVAEHKLREFRQRFYLNMDEIYIELLQDVLSTFNGNKDRLVIDIGNKRLREMARKITNEGLIFIQSNSEAEDDQYDMAALLEDTRASKNYIISDERGISDKNEKKTKREEALIQKKFIPFFPTHLSLGESNQRLEEYIYWRIDRVDKSVRAIYTRMLEFCLNNGPLSIIVDTLSKKDSQELENILHEFTCEKFQINMKSKEYQLVSEYYEAMDNLEMTVSLQEFFNAEKKKNKELMQQAIDGYLYVRGMSFVYQPEDHELIEKLNCVRIYLEYRAQNRHFVHAHVVSAGIPILSKYDSPYVASGKNGEIIEDKMILEWLATYLINSEKWNTSLVESVQMIEAYGSEKLIEQWRGVL